MKEDLFAVESFLRDHPEAINRKITRRGWTALHLATSTGNIKLVEKLVRLMSEEDLEMVNRFGATALHLAAAIGATRIAELLITKNKKCSCIYEWRDEIKKLFNELMEGIQVQPTAAPPSDFRKTIEENIDKMQQNNILLQELKQIYDMKLTRSYALEILQCISKEISTIPDLVIPEIVVDLALFKAVEHGIIEIVIEIIKANPALLNQRVDFQKGIIHAAILFRQAKVYNLVYAVGKQKRFLLDGIYEHENNILQLAAKLAPPNLLARISGAALQMQKELQWYKEVESVVDPTFKLAVNNYGEKPSQLFTNSHKQLMEEAEKWRKEIANSCTVLGAFIITIMFSVAFTVPGGNIQDSGYPIFLREKAFKLFITADAVSLFAASTSVLTFLGIMTSRYAEEDFLELLPKKLIIGLSTLFLSIAAMMIAFCATLIIMLDGDLGLIIPIVLMASVPVAVFIFLQFPLLVDIFTSTYGPGMFNKKMKPLFEKDPGSA
ncbi:uncharacterized protein LOC110641288 [Hevea brasiliensis]|uniref:uncharacterized protein LOC110641288 n=1 Tax=Hevea brasiliensis TaxID=3981 RepID=UPI0025D26E0E|nr:uncharacterized protein LOC110641288 [Hevea brasiliensis]